MEREAGLVAEFSIPVVAVRIGTPFLNLDVVDQLLDRPAIELCTDLIEVSAAGLESLVKDLFVCVNIVILAVLLEAVCLLRTPADLCIDENWVANLNVASARALFR